MKFFLCVIGMAMILEGCPYFLFPDKTKALMEKILQMPDGDLRKIGFAVMAGGLLCVYLGKTSMS